MLRAALILLALATPLAACCLAPPQNMAEVKASGQSSARIMVQFADANVEVERPAFAAQLADDSKVTVRYLRPMSGGAHVYLIDGIRDDAHLNAIIQSINRRSDVVYAEIDRKMKAQDSTEREK